MTEVSTKTSGVYKTDRYEVSEGAVVEKFRLQNGLKVIVYEDHSVPVFSYHTWFNVGSRNEREGITGIAHLFEHLMFKETKHTKEGEFDRILEEQGGKINAGTYLDWTFYREALPKEAFPLIPALEADRMQWVILNDRQLTAEREVVANERRFRVDNSPDGLLSETLYKTAFKKHPYYWPVIGWMKDIEAITLQDCIEFYKTYYAPNNATVVVVGDVDTSEVLTLINKAYGSIPASVIPAENLPEEPPQSAEKTVRIPLTITEEKMLMGYRIVNNLHPDFNALSVLNGLLFEGHSARLYRKLISDTSMASEAMGLLDQTKDPGLYTIQVSMNEGRSTKEALSIIDEEMKRLRNETVSPQELEKVVNRVETSFWSHLGTADEKAQNLGFFETVFGDFKRLFSEVQEMRKVTPSQIQAVAKTYLKPENRTIVFGEPKK